jgi:hypothetical protein
MPKINYGFEVVRIDAVVGYERDEQDLQGSCTKAFSVEYSLVASRIVPKAPTFIRLILCLTRSV